METIETDTVKVCRKCGEPKPTTEFYRESKGSRGREGRFRAICKSCWLGHEPEVTDDERKQFVKRFTVDYIKQHGETADEFFCHWISHRYPEITRHVVELVIGEMTRKRKPQLKVTRRESTGDFKSDELLGTRVGIRPTAFPSPHPSRLSGSTSKACLSRYLDPCLAIPRSQRGLSKYSPLRLDQPSNTSSAATPRSVRILHGVRVALDRRKFLRLLPFGLGRLASP
jgi:hypothetical protein